MYVMTTRALGIRAVIGSINFVQFYRGLFVQLTPHPPPWKVLGLIFAPAGSHKTHPSGLGGLTVMVYWAHRTIEERLRDRERERQRERAQRTNLTVILEQCRRARDGNVSHCGECVIVKSRVALHVLNNFGASV